MHRILTLLGHVKSFSKVIVPIYTPHSNKCVPFAPHLCQHLILSDSLNCATEWVRNGISQQFNCISSTSEVGHFYVYALSTFINIWIKGSWHERLAVSWSGHLWWVLIQMVKALPAHPITQSFMCLCSALVGFVLEATQHTEVKNPNYLEVASCRVTWSALEKVQSPVEYMQKEFWLEATQRRGLGAVSLRQRSEVQVTGPGSDRGPTAYLQGFGRPWGLGAREVWGIRSWQ